MWKRLGLCLVKCLAPLIIGITPGVALAQQTYTEYNKTVAAAGVQDSNGYVSFAATTANCLYNIVYFDITTDAGKAYLSVALTAKATNTPLSRVGYSMASTGICTATLVEL